MRLIPLTHGAVAVVDDEDFFRLSRHKWRVSNAGYAIRNESRMGRKERPMVFMHKEILGIASNQSGDHRNRCRLDNRRFNLRAATSSQNMANRSVAASNKLGIKGIRFDKDRNQYRARAKLKGREVHIGRFDTLAEASSAYRYVAMLLHGEFARA